MAELDLNTVLIAVLGFLVVILLLYVYRKPKLGSINPQILINRLDEVREVQKALGAQTCFKCKGPMEIDTIDLFGENEVKLSCQPCGVTLTWKKEKKGLQSGPWTLTGKKLPPEQAKTVMDHVREKVSEAPASTPSVENEKPTTPK